jgi:branched-subunit amino acid aminotransferase/4-amino-4-deoxychorismate lyase
VLHYAVECFEGMKAYKGKDGRLRLFRPEMNIDRLARSVARLTLPKFDKVKLSVLTGS